MDGRRAKGWNRKEIVNSKISFEKNNNNKKIRDNLIYLKNIKDKLRSSSNESFVQTRSMLTWQTLEPKSGTS